MFRPIKAFLAMKLWILGLAALGLLFSGGEARATILTSQAQLSTILGAHDTIENFETLYVPHGGLKTDFVPLSSTSMFSGSGPGLVQPGATYWVAAGSQLFWIGDGYFGLHTQTLGDSSGWRGFATNITYTVPVDAFGFDMQGYQGYSKSGTVSVYNTSGSLISATAVNGGFFGWENAGGIGHVVVSAGSGGYIMIDNHGYGLSHAPVPEPATIIIWFLLGASSWLGLSVLRRRGGARSLGEMSNPVPSATRRPWSPETRKAIREIVSRRAPR